MGENQRFCPNCGSINVEPDFRRTNVLGEAIFNQNKWFCKECDYTGIMPAGEPEEDTEFEEVEQETIDRSAGRAHSRYFFYIFIPLTVLYIIYLTLF